MADTTRRGFVCALLALAGCSSGDQPATPGTTTENCHYEAQDPEHTGTLSIENDTDTAATLVLTLRGPDGETVLDETVDVPAGQDQTVFETSDGGTYVLEYAFDGGSDSIEWSVPDAEFSRRLRVEVTSGSDGRTVDASVSTADPPATRVCE